MEYSQYHYFHGLYETVLSINQIVTEFKTIDIRPGLPTRYENHKYIEYYNGEITVQVRVIAVKHYNTLHDAFNEENWRAIVPNVGSLEEARNYFKLFYWEDIVQYNGGVNVIQFKMIK